MVAGTIDWLMEGDPAIRWQTMRDLLDRPESEWKVERQRVATEGWGAAFLAHQREDGSWPAGRWSDTTWTLLLLVDCGLPSEHPSVARAVERQVSRLMPSGQTVDPKVLLQRMDLCHLGFWLRFGSYFMPGDERWGPLAETILSVQMADGGWNCRIRTEKTVSHSSFHTTFNVLEGLREAADAGVIDAATFREAERRALEFMLAHRMYRSDKTGEVVSERFMQLTSPSHWHYTLLRGLDYMRLAPEIRDERVGDPISLLIGKRRASGRWVSEGRIPGVTLFDMEKPGAESRWNTLRALRILRAAGS